MGTNRLYRSRKGKVFGVCQGIADWKDLPVGTLRLIVAISILAAGIFPGIAIYALAALFMPLEPEGGDSSPQTEEENLRRTFESLKRKVEEMEEEILDKERDWDKRFHQDNT